MKMNRRVIASAPMLVTAFAILLVGGVGTDAQTPAQPAMNVTCPRPTPGAGIQEPEDLRSENGVLAVHVAFRNELDASRQIRYCYVFGAGLQSPNLRLRPGDLLILTLQNDLTSVAASSASVNSNPANISGATRREIKTSSTDPRRRHAYERHLHQLAFAWTNLSTRLPSGRRAQNIHSVRRSTVRVSFPHPRRSAAADALAGPGACGTGANPPPDIQARAGTGHA